MKVAVSYFPHVMVGDRITVSDMQKQVILNIDPHDLDSDDKIKAALTEKIGHRNFKSGSIKILD